MTRRLTADRDTPAVSAIAAGIGLRFGELREWKVAVLSGIDNGGFHLNKLLAGAQSAILD
jgi:hypothetical protein